MKTLTTACVVLGVLAGTASATEYEFKILKTEGVPSEATLNQAGANGWHIKQIITAPSDKSAIDREYQVFMQRMKPLPPPLLMPPPSKDTTCVIEAPDGQKLIQWFKDRPDDDAFPHGWDVQCKPE
tara:strand:- start:5378 stop:5755 length:378 start_codon:yes stop_codon:yes gene_type:complete